MQNYNLLILNTPKGFDTGRRTLIELAIEENV